MSIINLFKFFCCVPIQVVIIEYTKQKHNNSNVFVLVNWSPEQYSHYFFIMDNWHFYEERKNINFCLGYFEKTIGKPETYIFKYNWIIQFEKFQVYTVKDFSRELTVYGAPRLCVISNDRCWQKQFVFCGVGFNMFRLPQRGTKFAWAPLKCPYL